MVAFFLVYVVAAGLTTAALMWRFGLLDVRPAELQGALFRRLPYWPLLANVAAVPGVCVLVWCFRRFLDRRDWRGLGFALGPRLWREVGLGLVLGALVILLTLVPLAATGCVTKAAWGGGGVSEGQWFQDLGLVLAILVAAAFLEELVIRAYILTNLREGTGPVAAVLISSAIFAGLHLKNPHADMVGVTNILLAGVLMGTVFVLTGRIWSAWALHVAWNATLGMVLGLPVSGLRLPSMLRLELGGSDLATGGQFGPEASPWNTVALGCILVAVLALRTRLFSGRNSTTLEERIRDRDEDRLPRPLQR